MTTQDHKTGLTMTEVEEGIVAVKLELKTTACISSEAVEDNLAEAVVVQVDIAERLPYAVTMPLTEIVVHDDVALMGKQHVERYDEDGHSQVDKPQVQIPEQPYQRAMHPCHALGAATPLFVLQLLHLLAYLALDIVAELAERLHAGHLLWLDLETEFLLDDDDDVNEVEAVAERASAVPVRYTAGWTGRWI